MRRPWCASCFALQLAARVGASGPRPCMCTRCRAMPRNAMLSVHRALSLGYPLATLRIAADARVPAAPHPQFSRRRLEALVRHQPRLFDPARARADAATLRRERRAAMPELDAFRARLLRRGVPAAFSVGAHADAVARGLLGARRAVKIATAGAAACRYICGTLAPRLPRHLLGIDACARAFRDVCAERYGGFNLYTAADFGHWSPSASARAIANGTVRRVLATPADAGPKPMRMFAHAARVPWCPAVHLAVCPADTRGAVRALLLHFARAIGVSAGSEFVKAMCAHVFAKEQPGGGPRAPPNPPPRHGGVGGPPAPQPVAWGEEPFTPCCIQADAPRPASDCAPSRRVRFLFLLPRAPDAEEQAT